MTTKLSNAAAGVKLAALTALLNGGSLKIYTGSMPTNVEDSATGTLLLTEALSATAFGAPSSVSGADATAAMNAVTQANGATTADPGYYRLCKSDGTAVEQGLVAAPRAVTVTIASPGVFTSVAHGFANGAPVKLATNGALPTGLTAGTTYYVVSTATDTFGLSATVGGSAINTSGTQSGTHTVTRQDGDLNLGAPIYSGQPVVISSWTKTEPVLGA